MTHRPPRRMIRSATLIASVVLCCIALALPATAATSDDADLPTAGTFVADIKISQPLNPAPANQTVFNYPSDAIDLRWDTVPGATTYQLQVAQLATEAATCSSDDMLANSIIVDEMITVNRFVPSLMDASSSKIWTGGYCWRVRAVDAFTNNDTNQTSVRNYGIWSTPLTFWRHWNSTPSELWFFNDEAGTIPRATENVSSCTQPVNPNNPSYATECATRVSGYLRWAKVAGAASYDLQVSNADTFSEGSTSIVLDMKGLKSTRVTLPHLADDNYRWRVRAVAPNGTLGSWVLGQSFRVRWFDASWTDDANVFPVYGAATGEVTVGWTPLRGASYYEVQMSTTAGCFWEDASHAPRTWGSWVTDASYSYTDAGGNTITYPSLPRIDECRLSKVGFTTMNNWATLDSLWDDQVFSNIGTDSCWQAVPVTCVDASLPNVKVAGAYLGSAGPYNTFGVGAPDTPTPLTLTQLLDRIYPGGVGIYWRVRPVFEVSSKTETGYAGTGSSVVYGRWLEHVVSTTPNYRVLPMKFSLNIRDLTNPENVAANIGDRCVADENPLRYVDANPANDAGCLVMDPTPGDSDRPTRMQAGPAPVDPSADDDSSTLQSPLLTWRQFPGNLSTSAASGYIVQISREPDFSTVNLVREVIVPGLSSYGYGWQNSYAPIDSLPDNSEATGYWWRVVPCDLSLTGIPTDVDGVCTPLYYAASIGIYTDFTDGAGAQSFTKKSSITTDVSLDFAGGAPLISWYRTGATTVADKARGIDGANHYEVQLSNDPFMVRGVTNFSTTVPRWTPRGSGTTTVLSDGVWFYRVRAVDRNGLAGSWSSIGSFTKVTPAPTRISALSVSGPNPVVSWQPLDHADFYELQVSRTSAFRSEDLIATVKTVQTQVMPLSNISDSTGTWFWRVRASVGGNVGLWSSSSDAGPTITKTYTKRLHFAVSTQLAMALDNVFIRGLFLDEDNVGVQDATIDLQVKDTTCNVAGSYSSSGQALVTGADGEEGTVRFAVAADRNRCYRLRWADPVQVGSYVYSAPIPVKVSPVVALTISKSSVTRGANFPIVVSSNVPLTGYVKVQFRYKSRWLTIKTLQFNAQKLYGFQGQINYAGRFPTRAVFYSMSSCLPVATCGGYRTFEDVTAVGRVLRVNDLFTVYTTQR